MSLWGTVKGIFTGDNSSKAVDAVIDTGDALFFTDEEKSKASMEAFKLKIEWAKSTQGQNVSRRVLSWMTVFFYFSLIALAVGLELAALTEESEFVFSVANGKLGTMSSLIMGFYFGGGLVSKLK